MRTACCCPGWWPRCSRNVARQAGRVRLFELGRVFAQQAGEAGHRAAETVRVLPRPCVVSAAALQWGEKARKVDFHDLKGDLESRWLPLPVRSWSSVSSQHPFAHPGRSADVWRDGQRIGWIGQLHPRLQRRWIWTRGARRSSWTWSPLVARALPRAGELSRFPVRAP
ncbi:MAG: hypothetical protein LKM39_01025 [Chiayiivirga sp.]|jgi:phenylalanyl-tRNA synthetase beta chain|nr:hypothetical protein [Chiayiivirga sp.]